MFSGGYAYENEKTCEDSHECRRSLKQAFKSFKKITLVGISEMWELSILLLYIKLAREKRIYIRPKIDEISMYENGQNRSKLLLSTMQSWRFRAKKSIWSQDRKYLLERFHNDLTHQNDLDLKLYAHTIQSLCTYLHSSGLWNKYHVIQQYWREKIVETDHNVPECA